MQRTCIATILPLLNVTVHHVIQNVKKDAGVMVTKIAKNLVK